MKIISLNLDQIDNLLELEEQMYWASEEWQELWQKEAKEKFRRQIKDYLTNFPQGCFGLIDENRELLGAMFLIKLKEVKAIPYIHQLSDYLEKDGHVAYVTFFVVKRGRNEGDIAKRLYDHAENIALLKLNCQKIVVVIYSSPLEVKVLEAHNYEKLSQKFKWEIYPSQKVDCWIYQHDLLMKKG